MTDTLSRPPAAVSAPPLAAPPEIDPLLQNDCDSVRELIAGLDRLEVEMRKLAAGAVAQRTGYFPPDYDDRVRQLVLAYRNHRLALFEIIHRYRTYRTIPEPGQRLRSFMVAYCAALSLYAKSLAIISAFERVPLVRAKLNEPEPKFGLEEGFFDQVLRGYSSVENYVVFSRGHRFWRHHRRLAARLGIARAAGWEWMPGFIRRERRVVSRRLRHVLLTRLRCDWRLFWQTGLRPLRRARYNAQAFIGGTFAEFRVDPGHVPCIGDETCRELHRILQPGDVLLTRAEGKLTSALLPGFWAHAAIYLGDRAGLATLGLDTHPLVAPHWAKLAVIGNSAGFVVEALSPRVRIAPLPLCLRADHVCALRPNLPPAQIAAAIGEAFGHLGKPYDFDFDFNLSSRIVCTGLVLRSYHGRGPLKFELIKRLGRYTLSGDDMMKQMLVALGAAAEPEAVPFRPVALALTGEDRVTRLVDEAEFVPTLQRIQAGWRPLTLRGQSGCMTPKAQE